MTLHRAACFFICLLGSVTLSNVEALSADTPRLGAKLKGETVSRRSVLAVGAAVLFAPSSANAKYVLNEDGDYEEVEEEDWQTAWKGRLDKAKTMTPDEVFMAARGAGNTDLKEGPESDASKKRARNGRL